VTNSFSFYTLLYRIKTMESLQWQ